MNFILHNSIFDSILACLLVINSLIIILFSYPEFKSNHNHQREEIKVSKLDIFKNNVISFWLLIIIAVVTYFIWKYKFISHLYFIYYLIFVGLAFKNRKKNISEFTYENKLHFVMVTVIYHIFFARNSVNIYLKTFLDVSHTIKEYMLITFLIIKIIAFVFCLIINLSILLSSIKLILKKPLKWLKGKITNYINKKFEPRFYNFYFSGNGQNEKRLWIDIIIFILLCPILLVVNLTLLLIIFVSKYILKAILNIDNCITNYLNNSSKIITKSMKISTIVSLIIVFWIIVYTPDIITDKTKEVYNLIITVILIPLVYDSIRQANTLITDSSIIKGNQ